MHRIGHLYERIYSLENLQAADAQARKGKVHSYGVQRFDKRREERLLALHEALKNKTYRTSEYDVFTLYTPKARTVYRLPYYPDRIVHHAVMQVMEPIWRSVFPTNTYACVKGRGIRACANKVSQIIRSFDGRPLYCLKIDIRQFYPSVDHDILKAIIRRKIKDSDLLWLLDEIIDSADGLPIGNYLSQYFANLYLAYFLHWCNEQLPSVMNAPISTTAYADDIVFFASDKAILHGVFARIEAYLRDRLHLQIKGNWQIFPIANNRYDKHGRALDYVGYCFYRQHRALRKSIKQNFCRKVANINKKNLAPNTYKRIIAPWFGWAKHSDSKHLLQSIIPKQYGSILRPEA